jgi:hypothetical protein
MKMLTEYLDRALELERLAASELNEAFKTELLKQADFYRKLLPSAPSNTACRCQAYRRRSRAASMGAIRVRLLLPVASPVGTQRTTARNEGAVVVVWLGRGSCFES